MNSSPLKKSAGAHAVQPLRVDQMEVHAGKAERLLRALASRHRLMILCTLAEGELSVGALNEQVPLSQSALSQHLAVLRTDGLVTTRRESQTIYYGVPKGPALDIIRVLYTTYCCTPSARKSVKRLNRRSA